VPGFNVIEISYLRPDDLDFAGVDIWVSQTQGFDPDVTSPTATVSDNSYVVSGLSDSTEYYVRLRPFDLFGKTGTNTSAEFAITTKTTVDLTGLSGWAFEVDPADRAFIEANLADDAVPSEKIVNLTAAKITTGTLLATETITTEGVIRAVDDINNPQIQAGIGPIGLTRDGVPYAALMWAFDTQGVTFSIDELGNAYFQGDLEASTFTNGELTIDELGNLNSTGTFRFGGVADNFVDFNGTQLVIDTDNFSVDGAGNASFGGELSAATGVLGNPAGNRVEYDGTNLIVETPEFTVDGSGNATFSGELAADTVTTTSIVVGAVSSITQNNVGFFSGVDSGLTLLTSKTITTTSANSVVIIQAKANSGFAEGWKLRIYRSSSPTEVIDESFATAWDSPASFDFAGTVSCLGIDQPGVGTFTYDLQAGGGPSGTYTFDVDSIKLVVFESKV
jgi:hypothetical protein